MLHLTGLYPAWWKGRRFNHPVNWWAAGDTSKTVRDILQLKFLGPLHAKGTGFIPQHLILDTSPRAGVPDAIENVWVQHASGGMSQLQFKSYDQRREAFQGTAQHGIHLDEEPPEDIHTECLLRTAKTGTFSGGIMLLTFTPLQGLTALVQAFLAAMKDPKQRRRFAITATWDNVPHLSKEEKADLYASIPPYQRDARTKGVPVLGAGQIYKVPEDEVKIKDFEIPDHWPRGFGLDAQPLWKSSVHVAWDREKDTYYIYAVYKHEQVEPAVHYQALKALGDWIPGVGDASGLVKDAEKARYIDVYRQLGMDLELQYKRSVESGIQEVYSRLSTGRLRVFVSCEEWFEEFRLYRRDPRGVIVKEKDHLMDSTRCVCTGDWARGDNWMKTKRPNKTSEDYEDQLRRKMEGWERGPQDWMGG